jgi:hypothetical protein
LCLGIGIEWQMLGPSRDGGEFHVAEPGRRNPFQRLIKAFPMVCVRGNGNPILHCHANVLRSLLYWESQHPIVRFSSVSRPQTVMFPGPTVRLAEDVKHEMIAEQLSFCLAETTNWQHYTASLIRRDSHQ